jgi:hypothetical protein
MSAYCIPVTEETVVAKPKSHYPMYPFRRVKTMKIVGMAFLLAAVSGMALATPPVPEIDPGSVGSALALLTGALLVIRGRRK